MKNTDSICQSFILLFLNIGRMEWRESGVQPTVADGRISVTQSFSSLSASSGVGVNPPSVSGYLPETSSRVPLANPSQGLPLQCPTDQSYLCFWKTIQPEPQATVPATPTYSSGLISIYLEVWSRTFSIDQRNNVKMKESLWQGKTR